LVKAKGEDMDIKNFVAKRPVTFSFRALMGLFYGRHLGDLCEFLDALSWILGESISSRSVTPKLLEIARERWLKQFDKRLDSDLRREEYREIVIKTFTDHMDRANSKGIPDDHREWSIRQELASMASRLHMDMLAYYPLKKGRKIKS